LDQRIQAHLGIDRRERQVVLVMFAQRSCDDALLR